MLFGMVLMHMEVKALPNNKILILDWSKFKALADNKINVTQTLKYFYTRVENIVWKGEKADYHPFLLFLQCSQKPQ